MPKPPSLPPLMLPRALPLAFKSISGAKIFESLICDAMASLAADGISAANAEPDDVVATVAAAPADDGNDVKLLILPAPSDS